eukprot:UN23582
MSPKISEPHKKLGFLGFEISKMDSFQQFIFLAVGHILCAMIFAASQEKVFGVLDKSKSQLVTLGTQFVFTMCALLERYVENDMKPKAPLKSYATLSILTTLGMYFTNASLSYLSYPARIIFKSSKPLPTMGVEIMYGGKQFSRLEFMAIILLTIGICLFCFGEVQGSPTFHIYGLVLIGVGVTADALTSNYEKKQIFAHHDATHAEVMFFSSLFGMILTAISMGTTLPDNLIFLTQRPDCFIYIAISAVGGYFSVSFILLLIKVFGPTYAETVKGARKVFSIACSYILFPKPGKVFGIYHFIGVLFFVISIINTIQAKSQKKNNNVMKIENNNPIKYTRVECSIEIPELDLELRCQSEPRTMTYSPTSTPRFSSLPSSPTVSR